MPPGEQAATRDLLRRLANGKHVTGYEAERLTKRGDKVSAWGTASPLRDENGQVYACSLIERNFNELKRRPSGRSNG